MGARRRRLPARNTDRPPKNAEEAEDQTRAGKGMPPRRRKQRRRGEESLPEHGGSRRRRGEAGGGVLGGDDWVGGMVKMVKGKWGRNVVMEGG